MDLAQLSLLRELADRGSVTAVAEATGRTPSAVSQQLKTLQRQAGVTLVERVGRGVRLTDAGIALARAAVGIATAVTLAEETWEAYRSHPQGTVRLSSFYSAAELLLPGLLTRLTDHPGITVELTDQDVSQDDFSALTSDFDLVIAHRSDDVLLPDRTGLTVVSLMREPLDVGLPLGHRLAHRKSVSPADLADESWISVPRGYPLERVLLTLAAHADRPPRIVQRTTHLPLAERLVAAGHGIALLPRHTSAARAAGRLALVPLTEMRAGRQLEILMRPDRAARRVVQLVVEALVAESEWFSAENVTRSAAPDRR